MANPTPQDFLTFWRKIRLQMWEFASHDINPTWMRPPYDEGMNYARELSKVYSQLTAIERALIQDQHDTNHNQQTQEPVMQSNREPVETQYPTTVETTSGPCTVLRHRQIYQHIQLKLEWAHTGGVDFVWVTLADNCEDGFEVCCDYEPEPVKRLLRQVGKAWIAHWDAQR